MDGRIGIWQRVPLDGLLPIRDTKTIGLRRHVKAEKRRNSSPFRACSGVASDAGSFTAAYARVSTRPFVTASRSFKTRYGVSSRFELNISSARIFRARFAPSLSHAAMIAALPPSRFIP